MRILFNRLTALRRKTGVGHYAAELADALAQTAEFGDSVLLYPGGIVEKLFDLKKRFRPGNGGGAGAGWGRKLFQWHFQAFAKTRRFDLFHEPNHVAWPCRRPTVATVHDLSVLLHPQWHPAERVRHFESEFLPSLERCEHLLTDTEFIRREIIEKLGVAPERVTTAYIGLRRELRRQTPEEFLPVLRKLNIPRQFLLFVGTLEPRKNLNMLMRAYTSLPAGLREKCPLVLVGGWGWNTGELTEYFEKHAKHHGVIHAGYVADEDLPALYSAARALVLPSHYEGFGLPPLEMMACGGAVVASTAGSLMELFNHHAVLLDPRDEDGWRTTLRQLIVDEEWLTFLRHGVGEVAAPFTWERCARATWDVYRRVLSEQRLPLAA